MNGKNSREAITTRITLGRINQTATILTVLARPALFIGIQGLTVALFIVLGNSTPGLTTTNWWTVYGTIVDLGCLALLFFLLKREKLRIFDLLSFDRSEIWKDILLGVGIFLVVFPLAIMIGFLAGSLTVFGTLQPDMPPGNPMNRTLPFWAALYSRSIWWIVSAAVEELIYLGYALPRLQVFFGRTTPAFLWVGFGWSLQHSFLPYIDINYAIYAFLLFFPLTVILQLIYLRVRRLFPLIIGHWAMDCFSAIFLISIS